MAQGEDRALVYFQEYTALKEKTRHAFDRWAAATPEGAPAAEAEYRRLLQLLRDLTTRGR